MRLRRFVIGVLLPLTALAFHRQAAASTSDSSYSSPDLKASTGPPWGPAEPLPAARPWETVLRLPGRIVSLPFVGMGALAERSMIYFEQSQAMDRVATLGRRSQEWGIVALPASLGDHTGVGGEVRWVPHRLGSRLLFEANATTSQYNRERVTGSLGPVSAVYTSEWRPRELYFGPGIGAPLSGASAYAERSESATLHLAWGWQRFDSAGVQPFEPPMFRDRVRVRGPLHRTWVGAWAGPRRKAVSRGRDPDSPSFDVAHPREAAGSLDRGVEHLTYGAWFSHDARWGRPHWSSGWRASLEAERYDKSIRALALNDAHTDAQSFTRLTWRAETGVSFGRDPRTLRLALTAVDQRLDAAGGTFLVGDLQSLGGSSGLAGFEFGRFRDHDLVHGKLSYIFPLVKNLEFDVHGETGGVYPGLRQARIDQFRTSAGLALRFRTGAAMFGAVGCDWSSEQARLWFRVGGTE